MAFLGIELGSTRIKAQVISERGEILASGSYRWESKRINGYWAYEPAEIFFGLRATLASLRQALTAKSPFCLPKIECIGISGMMHGCIALDQDDQWLAEFRTWRNTYTHEASERLSEVLNCNFPIRWSVSHLYQALLNGETYVRQIYRLMTLSCYVHYCLTGEFVLGIGDAAGMFPIGARTISYDKGRLETLDRVLAPYNLPYQVESILPRILLAGEPAGQLSSKGSELLGQCDWLSPGILFCPPEGDAGTGMVATNCVRPKTGNISAGTSIFAMFVLEHGLSRPYFEIDMVATPDGLPVAMVHCNNGCNEIDAFAALFQDLIRRLGLNVSDNQLYETLYRAAAETVPYDGLLLYNYVAAEPITGIEQGCPLLMRKAQSRFDLAALMQSQLYSALASLRIGMEILDREGVEIEELRAHGGFFKSSDAGQKALSAATSKPVVLLEHAGEGGAYGIALLALYRVRYARTCSLADFLDTEIFSDTECDRYLAGEEACKNFEDFLVDYRRGLALEAKVSELLS
ncbi:MAG: FGGY family carbohydrate kinase [Eubacteriales bacterium]|nr:FGGY family carbohydrate kinase [Eubacteriales bacterium]